MQILYYFFVRCVEFLLPAFASFSGNKKLKQFTEGRKQLLDKLSVQVSDKRYWFHCASLGEFEQARPVMEKLKAEDPDIRLFITFFSPSGYEQRKNYELAETVIYLPLDTPGNAKRLIEIIQPKAAVFVKYEIWYFYLKALFNKNIPVYLISANFRLGQTIFKPWGKWLFNLLPQYKQIFLQTEQALELLKEKGLTNLVVSGDTRYDRVLSNASNVKTNPEIETFKGSQPLLILGSSWPKEEEILLQFLQSHANQPFKIIIAPHDISEKHIADIQVLFKTWEPLLYTDHNPKTESKVLILNTIGHLASAYHYADVAFIGGGFTGQLHNILEPLSFGATVLTGPVHSKFPEADMAKNADVLFEIRDVADFSDKLLSVDFSTLHEKAKAFIYNRAGASDIVISHIKAKH